MISGHRFALLLAAGTTAAATLTACGSSGGSGGATSAAPAPTTSTTAAAPATTPASAPAAAGQSLTASLTEFTIKLSSTSLKAGTYTFTVKNAGSITHALTVDGSGVDDKSTGDMAPGSTKTLTVTLKPGKYEVYCPVGNHKMEGMDDTVTVT
jgi:uncharacterized cupredoxin-like copper-binding protein